MKYKLDIKSAVLGAVLSAAVVFCIGAATSGDSTKWEHKVISSRDTGTKFEQQLDQLGREGWQVVTSSDVQREMTVPTLVVILKRPGK